MENSFNICELQGTKVLQQKVQIPLENERTAPVESFVKLEHYNAIQLVQNVHVTLASLAKVIKGKREFLLSNVLIILRCRFVKKDYRS